MATIFHLLDEAEVFSEKDGGAISRWAANVLREGSEIVVCPSFDASWAFPVERMYRLPYWRFTDPIHPILYRMPWPLQKWVYLRVFRTLLSRVVRGDMIYVHNRPETAAVLATVAQDRGIQIVLHMHNSHLLRANRGQLQALRTVPVIFCSEYLRNEITAAFPQHFEDTHVVYNGADDKKFRSSERMKDGVPTIIYTGRLVSYKGVHVLLEAMRILERHGVNAHCKVVGSSAFGSFVKTQYTRKLQRLLPSNTELVGYHSGDALAELLRSANIFCCPSIWSDPFPLAPLEAMATGLPVVASNVGGLPETLAYGGGLLVPPNNPESLASALSLLVHDSAFREKLGMNARESFRNNFLWSNVRQQYERALEAIST